MPSINRCVVMATRPAPGAVPASTWRVEDIASRSPRFQVGEHVHGTLGVQSFAVAPADTLTRLDLSLAPLPLFLSALGSSGMTAYFGLFDVGQIAAGETVVISSAAGAVGSIAGQIARLSGCKVIGIAGGPEKCRYVVEELGFDGAVDTSSPTSTGS
jgi:NADPH-dependent curcumin reductase CurA